MNKLLVILVVLISGYVSAQTTTSVYFHVDKRSEKFTKLTDSIADQVFLSKAIINFKLLGYVGLTVTDTTYKKKQIHYWLTYQTKFKKVILVNANRSIKTNLSEMNLSINKQLISLENSGFPFAKLKIVNQKIDRKNLVLNYRIDSGEVVIIDKIHINPPSPTQTPDNASSQKENQA